MLIRIRQYLRSDMKVLRWVFLALYVVLIIGLMLPIAFEGVEEMLWALGMLSVALGSQALFIFGAGTVELCRPVRKRRLALPIIVGATMLTVLIAGGALAIFELVNIPDHGQIGLLIVLLLGANWTIWFLVFLRMARLERRTMMGRMIGTIFAGSLLELMVTVPSHVVVSRRPGCMVGVATMFGIIAGVCVMIWSFGPAIVLLFLRPRYRREKREWATRCMQCGYDLRGSIPAGSAVCPECGTPIQLPSIT